MSGGDFREVDRAEIHIPDDADLGTGTFTTFLTPRALLTHYGIHSHMANGSAFHIVVNVDPDHQVAVILGQVEPRDKGAFMLPDAVDFRLAHALTVTFAAWKITGASLGGAPLTHPRGL